MRKDILWMTTKIWKKFSLKVCSANKVFQEVCDQNYPYLTKSNTFGKLQRSKLFAINKCSVNMVYFVLLGCLILKALTSFKRLKVPFVFWPWMLILVVKNLS